MKSSTLEVTIIGSGSTYGVPTVCGDWGDCDPNNSKNRRMVSSIIVQTEAAKILVDMSPDFREQSIQYNLMDLDAILYTHGHPDHVLGNFHLPRFMKFYKGKDLPLYADLKTQEEIEKAYWYQMAEGGKVQYSYGGETHWVTTEPLKEFTINDMTVLPLQQYHGNGESLGFRIGNFAYSTDFHALPQESLDQLKGLDVWLVECNRKNPSSNSDQHMDLQKVLNLTDVLKPKKSYLTHLGVTFDYDTVSAELPENVFLAYDGLKLKL
jgi:phosphoribosyl 1,2-cyclic phosphate phosphodiesterase